MNLGNNGLFSMPNQRNSIYAPMLNNSGNINGYFGDPTTTTKMSSSNSSLTRNVSNSKGFMLPRGLSEGFDLERSNTVESTNWTLKDTVNVTESNKNEGNLTSISRRKSESFHDPFEETETKS